MTWTMLPQEYHTGACFDLYRHLGAHPCKGGWSFRIWAPGALDVQLEGDFSGWQGAPMSRDNAGVWSCTAKAKEGQLYKFRVLGPDGSWVEHSDPCALAAELRPGTASRLFDLSRLEAQFTDGVWMAGQDKHYDRPMNIYEMHAGSWKRRPDGSWYDYEELAQELIPWLVEHQYTHVELLPLAEHPFDGSWGYQNTGYFAPTSRYGTPVQFARFVNACHMAGIGVLMDFVPVHFAKNADGLARLDGTFLYEYDSDVGQSEWGTCNFNFYRGEVRSFLNSAAAIWLDLYHCDGIRMDAISRALYWLGDPSRGVNQGAVQFLQNMNQGLHQRFPSAILTAEDSTNFLKVTAPVEYDGLGFDYKWDMGWMHDTLDFFATPFDQRRDAYHKLTFSMSYFYNELYLLSLSHDEMVHGKKAVIDKLWGTYEEKFAQARLLYFYMLTHPGKKLNFMGSELAHFREWDEERELDWMLLRYPLHDAFHKYIAALNGLYHAEPALYEGEYNAACFEWVACQSRDEGIYAYLRKGRGGPLLAVMNTQPKAYLKYPLYLTEGCTARMLFSTDLQQWGGATKAPSQPQATLPGGVFGRNHTLYVDLPPLSGALYRLEELPRKPRG
mgnify:FL=1